MTDTLTAGTLTAGSLRRLLLGSLGTTALLILQCIPTVATPPDPAALAPFAAGETAVDLASGVLRKEPETQVAFADFGNSGGATEEVLHKLAVEHYVQRIRGASQSLQSDQLADARAQLTRCPKRFRGWEWHYLHRLSQQAVFRLPLTESRQAITSRHIAHSEQHFAVLTNKELIVGDIHTGAITTNFPLPLKETSSGQPNEPISVALRSDGKEALIGLTQQILRLDVDQGTVISKQLVAPGRVQAVAFTRRGLPTAVSDHQGIASIYDLSRETVLQQFPVSSDSHSFTFNPNGLMLAYAEPAPGSGTRWQTKLVAVCDGKPFAAGPTGAQIVQFVFHPHSQSVLCCRQSGQVHVVDATAATNADPTYAPEKNQAAKNPAAKNPAEKNPAEKNPAAPKSARAVSPHSGPARIALNGDGSQIVSVGTDQTLRRWDIQHNQLHCRQPRPSGKPLHLATVSSGSVFLWIKQPQHLELWTPRSQAFVPVAFSTEISCLSVSFNRSGKQIAVGSLKNRLYRIDVARAQIRQSHKPQSGLTAAFNPVNDTLVTQSNTELVVFDTQGKEKRIPYPHTYRGSRVNFSHCGNFITAGTKSGTTIWNPATGKIIQTFSGDHKYIWDVAFSPNGKYLATAHSKNSSSDGALTIRDLASGQTIAEFSCKEVYWDIEWSPDGTRIAAGSGRRGSSKSGAVTVWELPSGRAIHNMKGVHDPVWSVAFSPDGRRLAGGSGPWMDSRAGFISIWEMDHGQRLLTLKGHDSGVMALAFSPSGKTLVSAGSQGKLLIWHSQIPAEQH